MKFPKINRDQCAKADASQCAAGTDGDGGGGNGQTLILEPGFAILCDESILQFHTFLASDAGQTELTQGLTYSTSDGTIMVIDSASGSSTKTGAGIVTISVHWRDLIASAQITCSGDGNCCADISVEIAVLRDVSASMQQLGTRESVGRKVIKEAFNPSFGGILITDGKDSVLRIDFSDTAILLVPETTNFDTFYVPSDGVAHGNTNISDAFYLALGNFTEGKQRVILVVSDGQSWPNLTTIERESLLASAHEFKSDGGLIICVGIAAGSSGFGFLQALSSGGFLINLHSAGGFAGIDDAIELVKGLLCLACAGDRSGDSGYGCASTLPGAQSPDPNAPTDVESGDGGGGDGGDLPLLPAPQFNPPTGTDIGTGLDVALSIPGHPAALIRYSKTVDGSTPADPATAYSLPIRVDVMASGVTKLRAQGREGGYNDSNIVQANYPQGASTNGLPIVWANGDMAPASPYPSVAIVSGLVGLITSLKVKLKNVNAQLIDPKGLVLVGPDGTAVMLAYFDLTGTSNQIAPGADITFDQTASGFLPSTGSTVIGTGSYKPTIEAGGQLVSFPSPAPAAPYLTTLAAFNGKNPNGTWSLYVINVNFYTLFGPNRIDGGFELQIVSS